MVVDRVVMLLLLLVLVLLLMLLLMLLLLLMLVMLVLWLLYFEFWVRGWLRLDVCVSQLFGRAAHGALFVTVHTPSTLVSLVGTTAQEFTHHTATRKRLRTFSLPNPLEASMAKHLRALCAHVQLAAYVATRMTRLEMRDLLTGTCPTSHFMLLFGFVDDFEVTQKKKLTLATDPL